MNITTWTVALLALFKQEFSYNSTADSHISIANGLYTSCVYKDDLPFKKGSKTFPRSELRQIEEFEGPGTYTVKVNFTNIDVPEGFDYSIYQVFGRDPFLMIRHREKQKQMVVFDGEPKIQEVKEYPTSCTITCPVRKKDDTIVKCGTYVSKGRMKCKDLHLKLGIYSQQMNPTTKSCITYSDIYFNKES